MNTKKIIDHISDWLKLYCENNKQKGFVVGISGGIDSAVASTLCARTGLPLICVELPIHQAKDQRDRAIEHFGWLKEQYDQVHLVTIDLTPTFDAMKLALPMVVSESTMQLAFANTRARLRMTALYHMAASNGYLVAGTGNKVEDFGVGFFTKYGDGGVDLSPLADLTKTEVYALATELGVVKSIQRAAPTDGLFGDSRTDEDQIGASYPELEWAMDLRDRNVKMQPGDLSPRQQQVLAIFDVRRAANRHKMVPIPLCEIPAELKS